MWHKKKNAYRGMYMNEYISLSVFDREFFYGIRWAGSIVLARASVDRMSLYCQRDLALGGEIYKEVNQNGKSRIKTTNC